MSAPCPVLGFIVTLAVNTETDREPVAADFGETLEHSGLNVRRRPHGRGNAVLEYVIQRDGSQATDEDRALVRAWAARWIGRADTTVGDLIDLNQAA